VELYEAYADYHDMMDIAEQVLSSAAMDILGTYRVEWSGTEVDLSPGWKRQTMADAVKEHAGIDFLAIGGDAEAVAAAVAAGVDMDGVEPTWGHALYECFDQKVEDKLIQPTFLTMHPTDVSPLAKRSASDPRLTERFELFICGSEMANAFSELNDPIDQRGRFEKQAELRSKGDEEAGMMDTDFLNALEYGMPPTGGMGIGIDRCVMLLTGSSSIRMSSCFPP
jgi:lysyl-tRNA synthetase class 2